MRHVVNFGLLFCFVTLAVTGVMAFVLPFSIDTTRVHVVFGLATMILVGLHLASRLKYFQGQVAGKSRAKMSRGLLAGIVVGWVALLAIAIVGSPPAQTLVDQGYEARHRADIVRTSPMVGAAEGLEKLPRIVAHTGKNDGGTPLSMYLSFADPPNPHTAVAVWAESRTGAMIQTLYLHPGLAYSDTPNWGGKPTPRHKILPLWRHRYTLISGVDPIGRADAVSHPTPTHELSLAQYLDLNDAKNFVLCVEINISADPNDTYSDPHIGQPSLLYTAYIEMDDPQPYAILELTGHGGGAESDGEIRYDLGTFTTAKQIVELLLARVAKRR